MIYLPEFIVKNIKDQYIRENFKRLNLFFQGTPLVKMGLTFFELKFDVAVTNTQVLHGLGFLPLDVIQTSVKGAGTITFNFDKFTDKYLDITTTGACVVRCFIGTYKQ